MTRAPARQRGAAAVELALVLPLLVAILFGTIDWGHYFFTREVVVNASREGARVGTLQFAAGVDPEEQAASAAAKYLSGALRASATTISTDLNADGGACPAASSCVRITYDTGGSISGFLGSLVPDQIVAYSEMRK